MRPLPLFALAVAISAISARAAATPSARELAAQLAEALTAGPAEIRLRLQTEKPPGQARETLQLRVREIRTAAASQSVYEVLWPTERKGESVYLQQSAGGSPSATLRLPDGTARALKPADPLFGSDLLVTDAIENFFAWKTQRLVGSEKIGTVDCVILESVPDGPSIYASVRSWIDPRRVVPLRIEKYLPSGKPARRLVTRRVVPDAGRQIPGDLTIEPADGSSRTLLDGSSIRRLVHFTNDDLRPPP